MINKYYVVEVDGPLSSTFHDYQSLDQLLKHYSDNASVFWDQLNYQIPDTVTEVRLFVFKNGDPMLNFFDQEMNNIADFTYKVYFQSWGRET